MPPVAVRAGILSANSRRDESVSEAGRLGVYDRLELGPELVASALLAGDVAGALRCRELLGAPMGLQGQLPLLLWRTIHLLEAMGERLEPACVDFMEAWIDEEMSGLADESPSRVAARAWIQDQRGDGPGALAVYELAAARYRHVPVHGNNYAYATLSRGRHLTEALKLAQEASALSLKPLASILDTVGWALHTLGRHQEARRWLKAALHHQSFDPREETPGELLWHLAAIEKTSGSSAASQAAIGRCLARHGPNRFGAACAGLRGD